MKNGNPSEIIDLANAANDSLIRLVRALGDDKATSIAIDQIRHELADIIGLMECDGCSQLQEGGLNPIGHCQECENEANAESDTHAYLNEWLRRG